MAHIRSLTTIRSKLLTLHIYFRWKFRRLKKLLKGRTFRPQYILAVILDTGETKTVRIFLFFFKKKTALFKATKVFKRSTINLTVIKVILCIQFSLFFSTQDSFLNTFFVVASMAPFFLKIPPFSTYNKKSLEKLDLAMSKICWFYLFTDQTSGLYYEFLL